MTQANSPEFFTLLCCVPLCALPFGLALAAILFLRRRGEAALPFLQILFDRSGAQDDALGLGATISPAKQRPDLRAIARQHSFDDALRAQSGPTAAPPPGFEPPVQPPSSGPSWDRDARLRDEDDEFGFSESDG
ncbi:MAG: hypothetical protein JNL34_10175 [Anaerolineae bacterium]|nr:hypothetical protein [Anaerolineae bacterium]